MVTLCCVTPDMPIFRPLCSLRRTTCVHNPVGYNRQLPYIEGKFAHFDRLVLTND